MRHLENAVEALQEPAPDKNQVATYLAKGLKFVNVIEKGSALFLKAEEVLLVNALAGG